MTQFIIQGTSLAEPKYQMQVDLASMTSMRAAIEYVEDTSSGPSVDTLILRDNSIPETYSHPLDVLHFFDEYDDAFLDTGHYALLLVLMAAANCGSFAQAFIMDTRNFQALPIARYGLHGSTTETCQRAFNRFQHLDLVLQLSESGEKDQSNETKHAERFFAAIPLEKVRSLKIVPFAGEGCTLEATDALLLSDFPSLERLEISQAAFDGFIMVRFLQSAEALQSLHLTQCDVEEVPAAFLDSQKWCEGISSGLGIADVAAEDSIFSGGECQDERARGGFFELI
ncbi:unnamed protein product [Zymoseptoria tritici ST99CH_1E4]|uniref:Uncharacterized protein n=1 Tax=Zymoseptoria tritici ST99CH_1E4 TaxID=1276532 RepID=A0A2H1H874_ZYMTR|nr:unnamed protein product [Zymoseptoria tritici ST99CH_1E4]